jgi:hypothetical protein
LYIMNNFPFGGMSKFETKFELENLEVKLLLNLGQIYWGFKLVWINLITSPKLLFVLASKNVNLEWHGGMANSDVSVQAPLDLV